MPMPFDGEEFTFTNPDGTEIRVRGWGNQFHAIFETLDGFTIAKNPVDGAWHYAEFTADGNRLEPSPLAVGRDDPRSAGLEPHLRQGPEATKAEAVRAVALSGTRRWEERMEERKAAIRASRIGPRSVAAPPPNPTVGTYVGLCVLIQFPDVPGTISQAEVQNFCNQVGYTDFGNNGSVRDYFFDVSDGRLTYTNIVTAYYTAANNRAHYTDPAISYGQRARELILEALTDLVAQGFDFSGLSTDGSGFVYALNIYYAGDVVNNWSEGLWPHSWSLASPFNIGGNRKFFDYQFTAMGSQLTLGTFCHENGHMICDFPDLYDYGNNSRGAGRYSLMAFGSSDPRNPVHVDAYLKHAAGWTTNITPITSGITAQVTAGQNNFYIFARNETEYFIIENRQQSGRDTTLPDAGLACWHCDETGNNSNEQMTSASHYELSLEQADGQFHLETNVNSGDGNDLFAGPSATAFSDTTNPSTRWWDGSISGLSIQQISAPGTTMSFVAGGTPPQTMTRVYDLLLLDPEPSVAPAIHCLLS